MKRSGKIIKLSPDYLEGSDSVFLIYRKSVPSLNPNEIDMMKNISLMRAVYVRSVRN
jgi:hypothetical protein